MPTILGMNVFWVGAETLEKHGRKIRGKCLPIPGGQKIELVWPCACLKNRSRIWEGDATKHFSVKNGFFSERGEAFSE